MSLKKCMYSIIKSTPTKKKIIQLKLQCRYSIRRILIKSIF
ncbi:hypothetical protein CoNPh35_CDS0047 [Staphylococcus phage S-CoN_Ph35]|nr:hypothetical protein CoNPh35_CDS0047 [Staphylococcus phage S-CoN_Ph35]